MTKWTPTLPHREIAAHVHAEHEVSGWWAQTVTVGYERIRGLRDIGQRRGGSYEANKSKTIEVPLSRLYKAFSDKRTRRRWLPDVDLTLRTSRVDRSMRVSWDDGTAVDISFTAKGDDKSQVSIQHRKLKSAAEKERIKTYWGERLSELADLLTGQR